MNKYTLREKIEKNLEILNSGLVGKEKVMKLGLLSILSGENMILVGPPGTAKSEISRRLREILADTDSETYFEYLFTKFTTPEEIFGPLSIKQLQNDKFERNTEGYMPSSRIVFLDEIFKANSSILNTLLTILNERVFHNGLKREKTPLISLIGASNELPFENDELTALYDRFLIRAVVGYVSDDEIEELLDIKETDMEIPAEIKFTESDLNEIKNESEKVRVTSGIKRTIMQIRQEYNKIFAEDNHEIISDRKLVKMVKLLKVSAYLNGRDKVDFSDLMILTNCLWNNPENIEKVTKLVLEAVKRNVAKDEE
ncbi:ATPase family protein [Leptotrichia sp. oral taxon 215 str. W9775]|uniref:AAA family ATPase n=1 Tax=Leptotrichia sp. oral taxon 215 TaxID=712359 RepID=UPI0003ADAC49|nr:AAA family ATPase [Leptotrichia sp. oral taxon 215]ERK67664.1 ATPase family protein [Leptotrichia sp. oral taxon 215 str. W9775]